MLFSLLFLIAGLTDPAPTILGTWLITNGKGEVQSEILMYEKGGLLYGKISALGPAATVINCDACKGADKGRPLVGMHIIEGLAPVGMRWKGGSILNPRNGKKYRCLLSSVDENTLNVRGYIGTPSFGRTQTWVRQIADTAAPSRKP